MGQRPLHDVRSMASDLLAHGDQKVMQPIVLWSTAIAATINAQCLSMLPHKRTPLVDVAARILLMDKCITNGRRRQKGETREHFGRTSMHTSNTTTAGEKSPNTNISPVNLAFVAAYCWLLWRSLLVVKTLALLIAGTVLLQDRANRVFSRTPCKCKT